MIFKFINTVIYLDGTIKTKQTVGKFINMKILVINDNHISSD